MHLALEVVARPTEVAQAECIDVSAVDRREHVDGARIHRGAISKRHLRQPHIAMHASVDEVHHVELRANDVDVVAQHAQRRHGHRAALQGADHAVFTVERMRRLQQLTGGLGAQDVAAAVGFEPPDGVGIAADNSRGLAQASEGWD